MRCGKERQGCHTCAGGERGQRGRRQRGIIGCCCWPTRRLRRLLHLLAASTCHTFRLVGHIRKRADCLFYHASTAAVEAYAHRDGGCSDDREGHRERQHCTGGGNMFNAEKTRAASETCRSADRSCGGQLKQLQRPRVSAFPSDTNWRRCMKRRMCCHTKTVAKS